MTENVTGAWKAEGQAGGSRWAESPHWKGQASTQVRDLWPQKQEARRAATGLRRPSWWPVGGLQAGAGPLLLPECHHSLRASVSWARCSDSHPPS